VGNHDLVALGELTVAEFNDEAAAAAVWTREVLTPESQAFLRGLEAVAERDDVQLFHASARDHVWEYVLTEEAARATLELTSAPVVLVGHSHVALALNLRKGQVAGGIAPDDTHIELDHRWLLNPGSVGQPRDGDSRAAWLLLDLDASRASFRRTPYDVARTQEAIRAAGLPDALAERLAHGV